MLLMVLVASNGRWATTSAFLLPGRVKTIVAPDSIGATERMRPESFGRSKGHTLLWSTPSKEGKETNTSSSSSSDDEDANKLNIDDVQEEVAEALKAAKAAMPTKPTVAAPSRPQPPAPPKFTPQQVAERQKDAIGAAATGTVVGALLAAVVWPQIATDLQDAGLDVDFGTAAALLASITAASAFAVSNRDDDSAVAKLVRTALGKPPRALARFVVARLEQQASSVVAKIKAIPAQLQAAAQAQVEDAVASLQAIPRRIVQTVQDRANDTLQAIQQVPRKVKGAIQKQADDTVQAIQQIPVAAKESAARKAAEIQQELAATPARVQAQASAKTKELVENIKATPGRVVASVEKAAVETVENLEKAVEESVENLEKAVEESVAGTQQSISQQIDKVIPSTSGSPSNSLFAGVAPPKRPPPIPTETKPIRSSDATTSSRSTPILPKLEAPKVEVPKREAPKLPDSAPPTPQKKEPLTAAPKLELPKLELPKVDLSKVSPSAAAPKKKETVSNAAVNRKPASFAPKLPQLSIPKIDMPDIGPSPNQLAEQQKKKAAAAEAKNLADAKKASEARLAAEAKRVANAEALKVAAVKKAADAQAQKEKEQAAQEKAKAAAEAKRVAAAEAFKAAAVKKAADAQAQKEREQAAREKAKEAAEAKRKAQAAQKQLQQQSASLPFGASFRLTPPPPAATTKSAASKPQSPLPKTKTAPRGVPTITNWSKRRDGGISGLIYGSPNFDDGDRVETSPIAGGAVVANGSVVQTNSGSRYFLSDESPTGPTKSDGGGEAFKALLKALPGSTVSLTRETKDVDKKAPKLERTLQAKSSSPSAPPTRTFSLFSFGSSGDAGTKLDRRTEGLPAPKKAEDTKSTAPKGVPSIKRWKKLRDNTVSGLIYGSPNFTDGERVTTSPIVQGTIAQGSVVRTGSGSRYFLD